MSSWAALILTGYPVLASAIVALWRYIVRLQEQRDALQDARRADQLEASKLMFALLEKLRNPRFPPPATVSEWEDEPDTGVTFEQFKEAKKLAAKEVNGDIESLVRNYLRTSPPAAFNPNKNK